MRSFIEIKDAGFVRSLLSELWCDVNSKDVLLVCGQEGSKAWSNRAILGMACPVLREALLQESECVICLPDFDISTVESFLKQCYLILEQPSGQDMDLDLHELARLLGVRCGPSGQTPGHIREQLSRLIERNRGLYVTRGKDVSLRLKADVEVSTGAASLAFDQADPAQMQLRSLMTCHEGQLQICRIPSRRPTCGSGGRRSSSQGPREVPQPALSSAHSKDSVKVKVRCTDCCEVVLTTMEQYRTLLARIQEAMPSFSASYRCEKCVKKGLPTEEQLRARKEEQRQSRLEEKRRKRRQYAEKSLVQESRWKDTKTLEEWRKQKLLCQFCGKQFSVVQGHAYWAHMNVHQNITPFKCSMAGCSFGSQARAELSLHVRKQHPHLSEDQNHVFQCDKCPLQSNSQKNLNEHIKKCHNEASERNTFECDQCFYRSTSVQGLSQHKTRWHKAQEHKFSCKLCDVKLGNRKSIYEHMRKIHSVERQCKFCTFQHMDYEALRQHVQQAHRDQMPFACHLCAYCTNRSKFLKRHLEAMHGLTEPSSVKPIQRLDQQPLS